jgi:hypothetical protein
MPYNKFHEKMDAHLSRFWVVTIINNPERFKRRYELYHRFEDMCQSAGVNLVTVEQAFGNRDFVITNSNSRNHLQVRSESQVWLKENLINLGIQHALQLAQSNNKPAREIAWIDADCRPAAPSKVWFDETWHQLQHYDFVQMWEEMIDLSPTHFAITKPQKSFMAAYVQNGCPSSDEMKKIERDKPARYYSSSVFGRPGLAWAARVDALNKVGGLIDFCVLGAGDWYMAHGLVGTLSYATNEYARGPYQQKLFDWQDRALHFIKKNVGYVPGLVIHDFHGKKKDRRYGSRGKILADNKYNPDTDITYDTHGMIQLNVMDNRQIRLRDEIRGYFRARNEDSVDL